MHVKAYLMMLLRGTMALLVLELLGTQFSAKLNAARIYKDRIKPNWAADSSHFWYRNDLPEGAYEFVLVDLLKESENLHSTRKHSLGRFLKVDSRV